MKKQDYTPLYWLIAVIVIIGACFGIKAIMGIDNAVIIRIIIRYLLMALSFGGISIIIYAFIGMFMKNRTSKFIFTFIIIFLLAFCYYNNHKKIVRMKEDVLYIIPH